MFTPRFASRLNGALAPGAPEGRNYLARELATVMRVCFGDLTDQAHESMLRACYVSSDVTDRDVKQLESFAGRTLPYEMPHTTKRLSRKFGEEARLANSTGDGESVLLVGRAGSGKSTFLAEARRRLLAPQRGKARPLVLHVDLKPRTEVHAESFGHDELKEDVCDSLLKAAEAQRPDLNPFEHELLNEVFARELQRLKSSLSPAAREGKEYDDRANELIQTHLQKKFHHLKAYLGFVARQNMVAVILFDNVDRGSESFEKLIHQLAQMIAQNTRAIVVTCLRETTFQAGKTKGFLDVGRHTVFTVSPPPLMEVVRRRFEYIRDRVAADEGLAMRLGSVVTGQNARAVFDFADILSDAVLNDTSSVGTCVKALAGTNVRLAFEVLEQFVASPHTDIEKVFRRQRDQPRDGVSIHLDDFLRSVMRGTRLRFEEESSVIKNLFQVPSATVVSHFVPIRVLQYLSARVGAGDHFGVRIADVSTELSSLGYAPSEVLDVVNKLGRGRLLNSLSMPEPPWRLGDAIGLGVAGQYYLHELLWNREYLENVVDDTVIYDESTFSTLLNIHRDRTVPWQKRYEQKAFWFLAYLAKKERDELAPVVRDDHRLSWLQPVAEPLGRRHFGRTFAQALSGASSGRSRHQRRNT